ncbi:uncharacterized protein BT62DRAFT_526772 [Guyanagaster necrorhizus]|uniref:Uncharacterized protein n=1 Tax=Guyanagaster necrorhizus TaxID=856835 RepID=A0A9P8AWJ4_9AGAR|nr:uncharacterized protein BT62DRAFT_526772 [Guyanagaster necrorhizus MCA 3950]KAG7450633.1 hypothetical protein BT62DRAFT_526772 [Guyanagaster necrorhizus MCA 3950]
MQHSVPSRFPADDETSAKCDQRIIEYPSSSARPLRGCFPSACSFFSSSPIDRFHVLFISRPVSHDRELKCLNVTLGVRDGTSYFGQRCGSFYHGLIFCVLLRIGPLRCTVAIIVLSLPYSLEMDSSLSHNTTCSPPSYPQHIYTVSNHSCISFLSPSSGTTHRFLTPSNSREMPHVPKEYN